MSRIGTPPHLATPDQPWMQQHHESREQRYPGETATSKDLPGVGSLPVGGCIGIDDGLPVGEPGLVSGETGPAGEFEQLFRAVYLTFHRRDAPRSQLANASLAVLEHLALAGPLTIGEAAEHLRRAQSVVSEIVGHLERQGLLERESDPADRRRTLVWLTQTGQAALRRQREVLSEELLTAALGRMPPEHVGALLGALRALLQSVTPSPAAAGHSEGNPS